MVDSRCPVSESSLGANRATRTDPRRGLNLSPFPLAPFTFQGRDALQRLVGSEVPDDSVIHPGIRPADTGQLKHG